MSTAAAQQDRLIVYIEERMSTTTERKWKFVVHLEKSKFFIFSQTIPYSGLRNVIGFFDLIYTKAERKKCDYAIVRP